MQAAKQIRFSRNCRRSLARLEAVAARGSSRASAGRTRALLLDRRDVLDRREGPAPLLGIGHVGVEQRQVELHVQRLLVELARQVHARLGRVDVLVEVQHEVVRDDRVAGGEERDQALRPGGARRRVMLAAQVGDVGREVDLLDRPGVLDGGAVHLEEAPGTPSAAASGRGPGSSRRAGRLTCAHWQASQLSGFSSEQADALGVACRRRRRASRRSGAPWPWRCASPGASAGSRSS